MHEEIVKLLFQLDKDLKPLRKVAESLLDEDSLLDEPSETALISRRRKIAPEAFACVIYPGMPDEGIARYEEIHSRVSSSCFAIPEIYKNILARLNGADVLKMSLYGLPPSMCKDPPLLSRSTRQPLDLATANKTWSRAFKPDPPHFHFGGAYFSSDENLAYFLNPDGGVEALRKGEIRVNLWPNFESFLSDELSRLLMLFPSYEEAQLKFRQSLESETKDRKRKTRSKT